MSSKTTPPPPARSFEEAMRELDGIVSQMEKGKLPLEEMIEDYRRAAGLVRYCREKLAAAQLEIKKLEKEELVPFTDAD